MKVSGYPQSPVLLMGDNRLAYSIALCLQKAGQPVYLSTPDSENAQRYLQQYAGALPEDTPIGTISVIRDLHLEESISMAIVVTDENLIHKQRAISALEAVIPADTLIAINTESIPLSQLQSQAGNPDRILGANWVEPANTTLFLEIIANSVTKPAFTHYFSETALSCWNKDPYIVNGDSGIRMRLFAAMIREAFYLIENGYANVGDIDRACRNDAGYYLPFAGNLRYMDLMGTDAYGMVMKDLNPELAQDKKAPEFFNAMMRNKRLGMESNGGFYDYQPGESEKWESLLNQFSHQINGLFQKYPFNYKTSGTNGNLATFHSENQV
ncbi:3-hydroxybutyryl-CoA dehydrogenase [Dyadobacter sp. CECT 9275]|uniref:3-hydroxybutyryl-CoA dehydrogenase n=1 Tax=Dyadobacter helix TaxID=2822344 RepID=A0A916JD09_9BACT|nr:3-hydroxyacyl-CoA dehydrogenase family protein [Dyadobacter sp. CECT 9275]CAG5002451.1 3-hydroxybutyryl-CoA dehydrogenase [Dyadobacter sp. CECT 9275]